MIEAQSRRRYRFDNQTQDVTLPRRSTLMLPARRLLVISLRMIVLGVCALGIWNSWKVARADHLSRQDTAEALRSAIRLAPDDSAYFMRLAQLDEVHSLELLKTALRLDPYNAQADIELGLRYEADGDPVNAEKLLLQAFAIDHTYLPRGVLPISIFGVMTCRHSGCGLERPRICRPMTLEPYLPSAGECLRIRNGRQGHS